VQAERGDALAGCQGSKPKAKRGRCVVRRERQHELAVIEYT